VEQDLFWSYPDHLRLERALKRVECLIVLDYLPSQAAQRAHVFLPTTTLFEGTASRFVNQEGRGQEARPVHRGGTPLCQISEGSHPPRTFLNAVPGGEPRAGQEVLAEMYAALSGRDAGDLLKDLRAWLTEEHPVFRAFPSSSDGNRFVPREVTEDDFYSARIADPGARKAGELELVLTDWTFGTEELSAYSRFAREGEVEPSMLLHPHDAARLGLAEGDTAALDLEGGELVLPLRITSNMPPGAIIVPRHCRVTWQRLKQWPATVPDDHIRKIRGF
jgi:NADH-quinone oxidoreductase subunit G